MSAVPARLHLEDSSLLRRVTDAAGTADWCYMHANPSQVYHPCFSEHLLYDMKRTQECIRRELADCCPAPAFTTWCSRPTTPRFSTSVAIWRCSRS
jgi:hypothetical protein